MSLTFLSGTVFLNHVVNLWYVCVLLIFLNFYFRDFYLKYHLRYIAPFAGGLLILFIDHFVRIQDGLISISALRKVHPIFYSMLGKYEYVVKFYYMSVTAFFLCFMISLSFYLIYCAFFEDSFDERSNR